APTSFGPYLLLFVAAMTAPLLAAAAAGAVVAVARALRGDGASVVALTATLAPYLLVAASGHQALRFLAPALPAAPWLAALGLAALPAPRARAAAVVCVVLRLALGAAPLVGLFFVDARSPAVPRLHATVPPDGPDDPVP